MLSPLRILRAFSFTVKGLRSAWRTEAAFRDDVILVALTQLFCLWIAPPLWLWLIFCLSSAMLLVTELLNTGIEYLADHISTDHHPLLGNAKDVGSAAVFILLCLNGLFLAVMAYLRFFAN